MHGVTVAVPVVLEVERLVPVVVLHDVVVAETLMLLSVTDRDVPDVVTVDEVVLVREDVE